MILILALEQIRVYIPDGHEIHQLLCVYKTIGKRYAQNTEMKHLLFENELVLLKSTD